MAKIGLVQMNIEQSLFFIKENHGSHIIFPFNTNGTYTCNFSSWIKYWTNMQGVHILHVDFKISTNQSIFKESKNVW